MLRRRTFRAAGAGLAAPSPVQRAPAGGNVRGTPRRGPHARHHQTSPRRPRSCAAASRRAPSRHPSLATPTPMSTLAPGPPSRRLVPGTRAWRVDHDSGRPRPPGPPRVLKIVNPSPERPPTTVANTRVGVESRAEPGTKDRCRDSGVIRRSLRSENALRPSDHRQQSSRSRSTGVRSGFETAP